VHDERDVAAQLLVRVPHQRLGIQTVHVPFCSFGVDDPGVALPRSLAIRMS